MGMRFLSQNKGISLVEVMIAAAILGVITVAFMQMFHSNNMGINSIANRQEVSALNTDILAFLIPRDTCEASFSNARMDAPRAYNQLRTLSGDVRYQTSSAGANTVYGGIRLEHMELGHFVPSDPANTNNLYGKADLTIVYRPERKASGPGVIERKISIYTKVKSRSPSVADLEDLTGVCGGNGSCNHSVASRTGLGSDNMYTEVVRKIVAGETVQGCFVYDENHSHADFRIETHCCE